VKFNDSLGGFCFKSKYLSISSGLNRASEIGAQCPEALKGARRCDRGCQQCWRDRVTGEIEEGGQPETKAAAALANDPDRKKVITSGTSARRGRLVLRWPLACRIVFGAWRISSRRSTRGANARPSGSKERGRQLRRPKSAFFFDGLSAAFAEQIAALS
jgi:hypothetical protein